MSERPAPEPGSIPIREQPIRAGEPAPRFSLPAIAADGSESMVSLEGILASGRLLLVFYQDDGMPICTRELRAFAQEHDLLVAAGIQTYGINTNGIGSHRKFQERDCFPFPLISDFFGEIVKPYGFWDADEKKSRRGIVAVGRDGLVEYALPHFNPGNVRVFEEVFKALGLA